MIISHCSSERVPFDFNTSMRFEMIVQDAIALDIAILFCPCMASINSLSCFSASLSFILMSLCVGLVSLVYMIAPRDFKVNTGVTL